jgi:hypothetical protein
MQLLLEHSGTPGTVYSDCLIYGEGGGILNEMELHETTDASGGKVTKFKGKFQEADAINKNKRLYPYEVLNSNVVRLQENIDSGGLIGECDHPTDSIIHFANCCHKVTRLWWDGNTLMGEGIILNTPMGKLIKSLINDGVRIGISSRGVGNGKVNEDGILVIGESYKLITFDAVADPSTYAAFQEKVTTTRRESVASSEILPEIVTKNETNSIDRISEHLVLACIAGLIKEQTDRIKARL